MRSLRVGSIACSRQNEKETVDKCINTGKIENGFTYWMYHWIKCFYFVLSGSMRARGRKKSDKFFSSLEG